MRYRSNCILISCLSGLVVLLFVINVRETRELRRSLELHHKYGTAELHVTTSTHTSTHTPYAWIYPENQPYLRHVAMVLQRLGYQLHSDQWRIMWSHDYPFTSHRALMMSLQSHQKVNHFAGSGYFTNKASLAGAKFSFMPRSYRLPQDVGLFKKEVLQVSDDTLWVMKSNEHRGIRVHQLSQLDLQSTNSFVQQFIRHPLLISGRKFDVGLYVAITSVQPLRVYVYNEEVLLRFCAKDYDPFDAGNVESYVVGDDYTPTWKIPALQQFYNGQMLSHKQTLMTYLTNQGRNAHQVWDDMNKVVVMVMLQFESSLYKATKVFADVSHFFELVRFDFVIDSNLKVWLMEVNMSPNLSSAHFTANAVMYEQVLFNLFSLVGIAQPLPVMSHGSSAEDMMVSDRDVRVAAPQCVTGTCNDCSLLPCKLCQQCQSKELLLMLKSAYLEHLNRRSYKRLFPIPVDHEQRWGNISLKYSDHNALMSLWFQEKCKQEGHWCS